MGAVGQDSRMSTNLTVESKTSAGNQARASILRSQVSRGRNSTRCGVIARPGLLRGDGISEPLLKFLRVQHGSKGVLNLLDFGLENLQSPLVERLVFARDATALNLGQGVEERLDREAQRNAKDRHQDYHAGEQNGESAEDDVFVHATLWGTVAE